jgi:hypothetical protein
MPSSTASIKKSLRKLNAAEAPVRRVVLDYELKEVLYRDLNKMDPAKNADQERDRIAGRHGLKVVDGSIPIPDLRIEYETEALHIEHIDLEFATREYRSQGMASKARAGFHMFARHQDIPRLRRVLREQELTARIGMQARWAPKVELACTSPHPRDALACSGNTAKGCPSPTWALRLGNNPRGLYTCQRDCST